MRGAARSAVVVAALALVFGPWIGGACLDCGPCHPCCSPAGAGDGATTATATAPGCCPSATAGPPATTHPGTLCPPTTAAAVVSAASPAPVTGPAPAPSAAPPPRPGRSIDRCTLFSSFLI